MNRTSKTLRTAFLAALAAASCTAADLDVPAGTSQTITETATYGRVTVNGALTIGEGVTFNCSTLCVASGMTAVASMTLRPKAKVKVTAATAGNGEGCAIGMDGGTGTLTLEDGATMTVAKYMCLGWINGDSGVPSYGTLTMNGNSSLTANSVLYFSRGGKPNGIDISTDYAVIRLNGESTVYCGTYFHKNSDGGARIVYNGGQTIGLIRNYDKGLLTLESQNGHDIILAGAQNTVSAVFEINNANAKMAFTGAGDIAIRGECKRPLCDYYAGAASASIASAGSLTFGHSGVLKVEEGTLTCDDALDSKGHINTTNILNAAGLSLKVLAGAAFDMKGQDVTFDGVHAIGFVTNSAAEPCTLTAGGADAAVTLAMPSGPNLSIVKTGSGKLTIPEGTGFGAADVRGGDVELCNRRGFGYPYYRFWADAYRTLAVRITEIELFDGDDDVTDYWTMVSQPKTDGQSNTQGQMATGVVDHVEVTHWRDDTWKYVAGDERTNRVYFTVHFGGSPTFINEQFVEQTACRNNESFRNPAAPVSSTGICQPLTGYRVKSDDKVAVFPNGWRFQGAMTGNDWRDLHVMRNYSISAPYTWTERFSLTYGLSPVSFDALTVADGTALTLDISQAAVSIGTLTQGRNVSIAVEGLGAGEPMPSVLPVHVGTCTAPGNLGSWRVTFAGRTASRSVMLEDGVLKVAPSGTTLLFR